MTCPGLLDVRRFPLCRRLLAGLSVYQRELAALRAEDFVPYPDRHLYSAGWLIFPLVLQWAAPPPFLQLERNRFLCPQTHELLTRQPRILAGGFSRLRAGSRVFPHADRPKAGVLRFHLCLYAGDSAGMELDGIDVPARVGQGFVFDQSMLHAARNDGPEDRDALLVDFEVTEAEAAGLRQQRGAVNVGPTSAE